MKHSTLLILIAAATFQLGNTHCFAQESGPHYAAAKRLFEATNTENMPALVAQMTTKMMANLPPEVQPHRAVFEEFLLEIATSEEYRNLRIKSYMTYLTKKQMNELTRLLSSDAFKVYRKHQVQILKESNEGIMSMLRAREGELRTRLQAAEQARLSQ